jgi:hypothetical protein
MGTENLQLTLNLVTDPDVDAAELADLTQRLRRELLELDVDRVELPRSGPPPPGAKAIEPFSLGTLIITLASAGGVLTSLIGLLQSWLNRNNQRQVKLAINGDTLEVSGLSSDEQQRLIANWLERQAKGRT